MNSFLIILALVLFIWIAVKQRDWAICLIILLLPTYQIRFQIGFVPMTFLESMILLLATVEFFYLLKNKLLVATWEKMVKKNMMRSALIFLFLLAAGLSVFIAPDIQKAAGIFKAYFLEAIIFYFLFLFIIDSEEKLNRVWKSLAVLLIYLSAFGIYQFITLTNLPFSWWAVNVASRRITSLLNHPNALALLLTPILTMLLLKPKKNWLYWSAIILAVIAIYLSFSRAALLALLATLVILTLFTAHKKKTLTIIFMVSLIILAIPFSREKIYSLVLGKDLAQQNRVILWSAALDILNKSPIQGVGLAGFKGAYQNYPLGPDRVVQNYPHNFFLNFWLETSLLGLVSIIGLLVLFYKKIFVSLKKNKPGLKPQAWYILAAGAGMTVILLHGLVDVPYFKNDLSMLFWLIYAIAHLEIYSPT